MCGIAGILMAGDPGALEQRLAQMVSSQAHRGPDDRGMVRCELGARHLLLGHRRLSIIDRSAAGQQPMFHPDTGDCLIFNGEIYNHQLLRDELKAAGVRFRGHSDTEVLLHTLARHGLKAFERLSGMYALAWFRSQEQQLVLARDPLGIKPLYFADTRGGLVFASEARAIIASGLVGKSIDRQGLAEFLAYGAVQHPDTLFEGLHSLAKGSYRVFDATGAPGSPRQFWRSPTVDARRKLDPTVAEIRETVDAAVSAHLVADVPVGVFLSSGIDSTIVAGVAARHTPELRSFTVGFTDHPDLSEFDAAAATARRFGLRHTEIAISEAIAEQAADAWLDAMDLPSIDGLNTYVISRAVRAHDIKVALSGLGGDELFAGYPSFVDVPRLAGLLGPLRRLPPGLRNAAARAGARLITKSSRGKFLDMTRSDGSLEQLFLQRRRLMSDSFLSALDVTPSALGLDASFLGPRCREGLELEGSSPVADISRLEMHFYQANTLLRDSDTNSMAHGLELRVPLLDLRLVELMATVPDALRLPGRSPDKALLRAAFPDLVPSKLFGPAKLGFTLPIRRWMLGPLRPRCEAALDRLKSSGLLRPAGIDFIWNAFIAAPETPVWSRAWALVVAGDYLGR